MKETDIEPYLKGKDAAKYLNISYTTLIYLVRQGHIPSYRLGTSIIRYKKSDLDAAMTKGYRAFTADYKPCDS